MSKQNQEAIAQPDIEIYIKHFELKPVLKWLSSIASYDEDQASALFNEKLEGKTSFTIKLAIDQHEIDLVVTPSAAGKAFTSLWFQSSHTPWQNDKACALSLLAFFKGEVRCSAATWTEEEAEHSEMWWVLSNGQERLVSWG